MSECVCVNVCVCPGVNMLPLSIKDDEYKPAKFNLLLKLSGWFR